MGLRALGGTGGYWEWRYGALGLLGPLLIGLTSIRKTPASRAAAAISLASRALMPIGFSTSTALRARRKRRVSGRCCGFTVPTYTTSGAGGWGDTSGDKEKPVRENETPEGARRTDCGLGDPLGAVR